MKTIYQKALMLMRLCPFGLLLGIMGCSLNSTMVPVSGPAAAKGQAINATFTWNGTGHGQIEMTLPSGEVCKGSYSTIADGFSTSASGSFFSQQLYATYHGSAATIANKQYGQALLTGDKGTTMQVEYFTSAMSPTHGYGLAKDNRGNIYRLIF